MLLSLFVFVIFFCCFFLSIKECNYRAYKVRGVSIGIMDREIKPKALKKYILNHWCWFSENGTVAILRCLFKTMFLSSIGLLEHNSFICFSFICRYLYFYSRSHFIFIHNFTPHTQTYIYIYIYIYIMWLGARWALKVLLLCTKTYKTVCIVVEPYTAKAFVTLDTIIIVVMISVYGIVIANTIVYILINSPTTSVVITMLWMYDSSWNWIYATMIFAVPPQAVSIYVSTSVSRQPNEDIKGLLDTTNIHFST